MLAPGFLQQPNDIVFSETRIARFDREKETVVRCAFETLPVENRMIPARQAVHDQNGEERRERREENGQLEHDREERWYRFPVDRLSVNNERIDERRRAEGQHNGG